MASYVLGDDGAFARLFQRLAPRLYAFFMRSLADRAVAEDLLQTTFLRLHRARHSYRSPMPVRPWVFAVAARVRADELRRRLRQPEDADEESLAAAAEDPSRAEPADVALERRDRAHSLSDALARLPESQRVVLQLHRYEGMTFGEIASVLQTSEGAVRVRACRAYESLRKQLAGLSSEER